MKLFGFKLPADASSTIEEDGGLKGVALPYRLRDDFLSPAELSFYHVLVGAVGDRATVCAKVNLADVFFVARAAEAQRFRNKIDRKHVDFLLCDPRTMAPRCGVELDDSSHARPDRQERDEFVERVFECAGLPLVRVPAKAAYSPSALQSEIAPHLNSAAKPNVSSVAAVATSSGAPQCPKCGVPMVQRTAKRGASIGQTFWGCSNYPQCRETRLDAL